MNKILVCGAGGKMGSETVKAILKDSELELVGGVDPRYKNKDISTIIGSEDRNILCYESLEEALHKTNADIVVDFTSPAIIYQNACTIIKAGKHCVIGTTGLTEEQRNNLHILCSQYNVNILVAPNFSLGAVMMMKISAELAPYFPNVEIIELHHNHKYDAPSGTSILTAKLINDAREKANIFPNEDVTKESLVGARGATVDSVPIHSIRLPGYVAHQEVLFGGHMETLTIRHDSLHRESFMPGVMLACKKITLYPGLTYGLENYL